LHLPAGQAEDLSRERSVLGSGLHVKRAVEVLVRSSAAGGLRLRVAAQVFVAGILGQLGRGGAGGRPQQRGPERESE
jgi:hypothetical protein